MTKRVLIVDDAAFMRIKLKDILEKNSYEVAGEAENGHEAIEKYKELQPDIVTMDITMPEMDGVEALKEIKGIEPDSSILMCIAMGKISFVIEAIRSGSLDIIFKSFYY